jgi:hypothetical protein
LNAGKGINYQSLRAAARKKTPRGVACCKIIKAMRAHAVAATQCRQLIFIRSAQSRANKTSSGAEPEWTAKSRTQSQSLFTWRYEIHKTTPSIDAGECAAGDEIKK